VGNETNVGYCLEGLAVVAGAEGRVVRAARLWGAAEALLEAIEVTAYIYASDRSLYQSQVIAARARLTEEAFAAAWTEGREMTAEQAIKYALSEENPIPSSTASLSAQKSPADEHPAILTHREKEIANLVGRGLTNRQIAEDLTLSERTVDTHVGRILKKLSLRSREQVAVWIAERPPHDAN
jgi:non-specific serine/threonine protein kinase